MDAAEYKHVVLGLIFLNSCPLFYLRLSPVFMKPFSNKAQKI